MTDHISDSDWYRQQSMECSRQGRAAWERSAEMIDRSAETRSSDEQRRLRAEARVHQEEADGHFQNAKFFGNLAMDARRLERMDDDG